MATIIEALWALRRQHGNERWRRTNVESELEWEAWDLSSDVRCLRLRKLAAIYASRWSGAGHLRRGHEFKWRPHLIVQMSPAGYS